MKQFFTIVFCMLTLGLAAQAPVNDDCSGLIDLGVAPACPDVFFSNVNATASNIGFGNIPQCFNGGGVQNDVWFAFTTSDTIFNYTVTVTGMSDGVTPAMVNPQVAIYRGDCEPDGLAELVCASADLGESIVELDVEELTPNVIYFLRINDYSATGTPNWGSFQVCVDETPPANNIDEGGSTACSGLLYDSGGPDADYGPNEDYTFSICPSEFNQCINFTLDYFNIEDGSFDQLNFFDGPEVNPATLLASIGGFNLSGGGAVCFQVQASSGCLTVQFVSDGSIQLEGFAGSWQCSAFPCEPYDPVVVEEGASNEQIENFVSTPQTLATVTSINCPPNAYGTFVAGDTTDLGLDRGLLLTTGDVNNAPGRNNSGSTGLDNDFPGDPDLDYLSTLFGAEVESFDACVVEMDVFAATNELTFEYVFGSEEYTEFVGSNFNDIFAFLASGPGIVGDPNMNNQINIAVLPDGATPVQINSVNNIDNWQYYRNNELGQSLEYDGLTSDFLGTKKSLTARVQTIPCNTYHLKLAIADRNDGIYDSGVFISEIRGGTPKLEVVFNSGIDYLIEDCTNTPDELVVRLNSALEDTVTYKVNISGTAILGVDYDLVLPDAITFLPGQTEFSFPITPLSDLIDEDIETIIISLSNDFGCGEVTYTTLTIELHDELVVDILAQGDTLLVCADSSLVVQAEGAATYFWSPAGIFSDPTSDSPAATPGFSRWVKVEGFVGAGCTDVDSVFLKVIDPMIEVAALDPTAICRGDSVHLVVTDNVDHSNLTWFPALGLSDPNGAEVTAKPQDTTLYIASVNVAGCVVMDSVLIDVNLFEFPEIANDTTICQNYSVQLAALINPEATNYTWTPATGLDNDTISGPLATPDATTTYTLTAESVNGACSQTADITVQVLPADVNITAADTVFLCLGETLNLDAVTSTGVADNLIWSPGDSTLSDTLGLNVIASPEVTTWYYATFTVGACVVMDSVLARVDSLPDLSLMTDPMKDFYCQGDIVKIISANIYEPSNFPDIAHTWTEGLGFETPDSLAFMVFTAQDTAYYTRITVNNACRDTNRMLINVVEPQTLIPHPSDTTICEGQTVQVMLEFQGQGDISWEPEENISCTDCLNPVLSTPIPMTYTVKAKEGECTQEATVQVNIRPLPVYALSPDVEICAGAGTQVQLNSATDGVSDYQWTSSVDPNFTSGEDLLTVSPDQTTTFTLTATNECGSVGGPVKVTVVPQSFISLDDASICLGNSVTLVAEGSAPDGVSEVFSWTVNGQPAGDGTNTLTINPEETSQVTVNYVYGDNCGSDSKTVTLTVFDNNFPVELSSNPVDTVYSGEELTLTANVTLAGQQANSYSWSGQGVDGQTTTTNQISTTQRSDQVENLSYQVQVTTDQGCIGEGAVFVVLVPNIAKVPNVFTPNGDEVNDVFKVYYNARVFGIRQFRIYNRWGQLVYDGKDNNGWDGTYKGQPAVSDVYIYQIAYEIGGEVKTVKGDVTLLR